MVMFATEDMHDFLVYHCFQLHEDGTCDEQYRQIIWLSLDREATLTDELKKQMVGALRSACVQVGDLKLVGAFEGILSLSLGLIA